MCVIFQICPRCGLSSSHVFFFFLLHCYKMAPLLGTHAVSNEHN